MNARKAATPTLVAVLSLVIAALGVACQPTNGCGTAGTTVPGATSTSSTSSTDPGSGTTTTTTVCVLDPTATTTSTVEPPATTTPEPTTTSTVGTTATITPEPTTTTTSPSPSRGLPLPDSPTILLLGDSNLSTQIPGVDHSIGTSNHYLLEQYPGQGLTYGGVSNKYGPQWVANLIDQLKAQANPALIMIEMDSVDTLTLDPAAFPAAIDAVMAAAGTTPVVWFDVPSVNVIGKVILGQSVSAGAVEAINADLADAQIRYPSLLWVISSDGINNTAFRGSCPVQAQTPPATWSLQPQTNCYADLAGGNPHYNDNGYRIMGLVEYYVVSRSITGGFQTPSATLYANIQAALGI